jgi:uncharacterized protein YydD (DUF2326 family)
MFQLERLFSEPPIFDPIKFQPGLNVILGEKDDSSSKNNGVGKSLCVEFINFALLKQKSRSRIARVPKDVLPESTSICLNFKIDDVGYTIKRSVGDADTPTIIIDGEAVTFSKVSDATKFLTQRLFQNATVPHPDMREALAPLMRDERSEFKSIISCFDTALKIPDNFEPHLYLLGIDIEPYREIRSVIKELEDAGTESKRIKDGVQLLTKRSIDDARAEINDLASEVAKINKSIEALENTTGYDTVKDDIIKIENEIDQLRRERSILKSTVARMQPISREVTIDSADVARFYDHLKAGLGGMIARELDEVISFKTKIEEFQRHLLDDRMVTLREKIDDFTNQIELLDERYRSYLQVLDVDGKLISLRQTYAAAQAKGDELSRLNGFLSRYDALELEKQKLRSKKEGKLVDLQASISDAEVTISSVEATILDAHEFIQGNRRASFDVKTTSKKQAVEVNMRIDDDGSHSVDREKVFIYDISVMIDPEAKQRHLGFLVHDNIFEVDDDTLSKSLRFLTEEVKFEKAQQYVLTLNADRLEATASPATFDKISSCTVATFTKSSRFLKQKYQERM